MNKSNWWLAVFIVAGVIAVAWYWQANEQQDQKLQAPPFTEPQPVPVTRAEPQIRHPIREAEPRATTKALPLLNESDAAMQEMLTGFFGQKTAQEFFDLKDIVRRFAVTVDNLPRKKVPMRYRLFKPAVGQFLATGEDQAFLFSRKNYSRYQAYVLLAEAVDAKQLVAAYIHFYPLIQEEYKNLGYPSAYFNDRLVEAIDDLLAAPDVPGEIKLVRPNVLYQFADPELEALSAGQKIMIRMGSENAARVKARLREVRRELTGPEK
jgi:hypothetical protein